jgi:hypothetical protein
MARHDVSPDRGLRHRDASSSPSLETGPATRRREAALPVDEGPVLRAREARSGGSARVAGPAAPRSDGPAGLEQRRQLGRPFAGTAAADRRQVLPPPPSAGPRRAGVSGRWWKFWSSVFQLGCLIRRREIVGLGEIIAWILRRPRPARVSPDLVAARPRRARPRWVEPRRAAFKSSGCSAATSAVRCQTRLSGSALASGQATRAVSTERAEAVSLAFPRRPGEVRLNAGAVATLKHFEP